MKRHHLILIAVAVFAIASTPNAFGQTGKAVKTDIKFDFRIGERIYPAGEYLIERLSGQSDNILQIRSVGEENISQVIAAGIANAGKKQTPKLVFRKDGQTYFLTRIYLNADEWGYTIQRSRRHRAIEKNPALAALDTVEIHLAK